MKDYEESWNVLDSKNSDFHRAWEHRDTGDRIEVSEFEEDETWDTFLNDRLIANRDAPDRAIERARELMENGID